MRRAVALCLTTLLVSAALGSGVGLAAPPAIPDHMTAWGISPPGQDGGVTPAEFASGNFGTHFSNQLELYADLVEDDDVAELDMEKYFHTLQFSFDGEPGTPKVVKEGVEIYRDNFGIPRIYADSMDNASFALGYVTAEDRMFEMDLFRHAARGTLAEFLGPGPDDAYINMDVATRREGYTEEEVQKMFDDFDDKFGETGAQIQAGLTAYAEGVNRKIDEYHSSPQTCDVAYQATANTCPPHPEEWTVLDTLYVAILQLRVFGETAGDELQNAGVYAHLVKRHGAKLGAKMYNDLFRVNDPRSETSIAPADGLFPAQDLGKVNPRSFAIPDEAEKVAEETRQADAQREAVLRAIGFPTGAMSNALLVSAEESATGNPLEIGAPQVGYAVPSFFMEVDVHAPGVDFRGPAVPGASALIPLGRGADYAWSLTTGYSDAVDTRVELLCDPKGGEAKQDSDHYMFKGECIKMESRTETFDIGSNPTDPSPPDSEEHTFYRTVHGPVFARGKVGGKPVAFVKERFFWKRELDSIPQFYRWNTQIDDIDDFQAAARQFTMSFNSFYADHDDIGYFHVGFYPKRPQGYHPSLPTWGTGRWEWRGRLPFRRHPKTINPSQGWVANWNNKPSKGWDNMDGIKWGAVHRVDLLDDKMHRLLDDGGKATLTDLVDVIREAATQDTRGVYVGRRMVAVARKALEGGEAKDLEALEIVAEWIEKGAHRKNLDRDDNMDDGNALALFDLWFDKLAHKIFDDELGGNAGLRLLPAPITDYEPEQGSSFWFGFEAYIKNLLNAKARRAYARNYCDNIASPDRESCGAQIVAAFKDALKELREDQGDDPAEWTTPAENIVFREFGAGSVSEIPWQNRGTWNHAVEILEDAPSGQ